MSSRTSINAIILSRLTYASRSNPSISSQDLTAILQQAKRNNQAAGITGMLSFNKKCFLQTIEGARAQLNELLEKLTNDDRHYDLQIIEFEEINERRWSKWSMNYAVPSASNRHIFLKYSASAEFNPYLLDADSAASLLKELDDEKSAKKKITQTEL